MYKELQRTCRTIVLLIRPFVYRRSRCRCRRGYLKLPIDDGDDDGGVAQDGCHTPNNKLAETCSLGLLCTSLILDFHVVIN